MHGIRTLKLVLLGLVLVLPAACGHRAPAPGSDGVVDDSLLKAATLVGQAIAQRDEGRLKPYLGKGKVFLEGDKLYPGVRQFLFDPNEDPAYRSAAAIAADGRLLVRPVAQDDGTVIVLYYPARYADEIGDDGFLETEWMKKYFACWFERGADGWQLHMNVCFAETDGPYPPAYGARVPASSPMA